MLRQAYNTTTVIKYEFQIGASYMNNVSIKKTIDCIGRSYECEEVRLMKWCNEELIERSVMQEAGNGVG